jgi:hypothetical protein
MVGSRALGVLWLGLDVAILTWLVGVPRLRRVWLEHRAGAVLTIAACTVGSVASVAWQVAVPAVGGAVPAVSADTLVQGVVALPEVMAESIGIFGWQNTDMPRYGYAIWGALTIALVLWAMRMGTNRERKLVDATIIGVGALVILIGAVLLVPIGYVMQGRYILPIGMAIPLIAGEVLTRHRDRVGPARRRLLILTVFTAGAFVQFVAWYANAHRAAVGTNGSWMFLSNYAWSPVAGWVPWVTIALLGSFSLGIAAILGTRESEVVGD